MDQAELEECMKDLDINKNNQITYQDFRKWWLSGKQGLSKWMRRLLAFKLKTLKFMDTIGGTLKDVVAEADSVEISTSALSINLNKVEKPGLSVFAKAMFLSPDLKEEYYRIKALHKFGIPEHDAPIFGNLTLNIKDGDITAALAKCEEYISNPENKLGALKDLLSFTAEGHRLCIGYAIPRFTIGELIEDGQDMIDKV